MTRKEIYSDTVVKICKDVGVDFSLMSAIITIESSWNPLAIRFEPSFKFTNNAEKFANILGITIVTEMMLQHFSFGLGQIMGCRARDLGMKDSLQSLCVVETGSFWAAINLKKICEQYSSKLDQISAYNAGTPKKRDDGSYLNQEYVDKVIKVLSLPVNVGPVVQKTYSEFEHTN